MRSFVNALGKTQLFSSPALSATDFATDFSRYAPPWWKLPAFHKAPVDDDPRQAPYYTDHNQSPHINQLFAAMYNLILCSIPKIGLLLVACKSRV